MTIDKNIMVGAAVIGLGLFLAYRAKKQGKTTPIIGKLIPVAAPAPTSKFSGADGWDD